MEKGKLIVFEGCDGSGKTTVSKEISDRLSKAGYPVIYTREPGGSEIAEEIRHIILNPKNTAMDVRTEALLYAASRRQHLVETIIPAIDQGKIVISDRYVNSSLVYQGYARKIGIEKVKAINDFAIEGYSPYRTIYLDIDPQVGLERLKDRKYLDRLDKEALAFHQLVHEGYKIVNETYKDNIEIFDASKTIPEVVEEVYNYLVKII